MTPFAAAQLVQWGGLAIGIALGALAQATRFCTMGALADWFSFRGPARLMMWLLAVAVAALGSQALIAAGMFDASRSLPWSPHLLWLSTLAGGLLFGAGMVFASGCPQRNLVKAGAGNLKSIVVLLSTALAAQMTLRGIFAVPRSQWLDRWSLMLDRPQDVGSLVAPLVGSSADSVRWIAVALLLALTVALLLHFRRAMEPAHWTGGALIGLLVPASWLLTGQLGFIAEHPQTLEPAWLGTHSNRPEGLTFAAPLAHTLDLLTLWSDRNTTLSFGVAVTLGVVAGSALSALARREFRVESFRSSDDLVAHLLGGVLMGVGGVTALGCSIGQGLTGLSMLS
ncbi:partial hypothetical protein, partial [Burkholderiaceae bacterium]